MSNDLLSNIETVHRETYEALTNYLGAMDDDSLLDDFHTCFDEYMDLLSIDNDAFLSDELDDEIAMLEDSIDDDEYGKLRFYLGGSPDFLTAAANYDDQLPSIILSLINS